MRICNTCGTEKPLSEYWRDGRNGNSHRRCKACDYAARRTRRAGTQTCRRCEQVLPVEEFPLVERRARVCNRCRGPEGMTPCARCGATKPNAEFAAQYRYCKPCAVNVNKERNLRAQYRLTPDEYELMLKRQSGLCAVCGKQAKLRIDHDHSCCPGDSKRSYTCGKCLRGLLCDQCNRGLGMFFDSPEALRRAADYVEQWRAALPVPELFSVREIPGAAALRR